ncbi:MAG: 16S rRNA (cytosine(1402)-N(4))-methyltransferase RsmH [Candidatus Sumerlaeales bacterium]|nr:16S rRNA (cytosine(1402)-N(4))-methyltransferase RsmH [Candidatus Sumerlaeales bacterium]
MTTLLKARSSSRMFKKCHTEVHTPVLLSQVCEMLSPNPGDVIWDLTVGAAGHAATLLRLAQPNGFLLGIDRDPEIAEIAVKNLEAAGFIRGKDFEILVSRFSEIASIDFPNEISKTPDIILADLGVSSLQFDEAARGFSFRNDGPLNMQMNADEKGSRNAADIIANCSLSELEHIFRTYGEEKWSRRIASVIVEQRQIKPILTTRSLRETVASAVPRKAWPQNVDVATRVFQALRIAVNNELDELDTMLEQLPALLKKNGSRAGIISFHSLEDRRVKQAFRAMTIGCICPKELPCCVCGHTAEFKLLSSGGLTADKQEVENNPRSRSARLRGTIRIKNADQDLGTLKNASHNVTNDMQSWHSQE